MAYKVKLLSSAHNDLEKAFDYYTQEVNLATAKKFNKQLQEAYKALSINPFYEVRFKDYRSLPLKTFPFVIIFTLDEHDKTVRIYSIFHTSQNPSKKPQ